MCIRDSASPISAMATGDKYLDSGKLYVAKFSSDGSGQWVELSIANPAIAGYTGYAFANQGDVCVNARIAADAVGATKMDRPEWCGVNPANGEIYFTLTNNSNRTVNPSGSSWPSTTISSGVTGSAFISGNWRTTAKSGRKSSALGLRFQGCSTRSFSTV